MEGQNMKKADLRTYETISKRGSSHSSGWKMVGKKKIMGFWGVKSN